MFCYAQSPCLPCPLPQRPPQQHIPGGQWPAPQHPSNTGPMVSTVSGLLFPQWIGLKNRGFHSQAHLGCVLVASVSAAGTCLQNTTQPEKAKQAAQSFLALHRPPLKQKKNPHGDGVRDGARAARPSDRGAVGTWRRPKLYQRRSSNFGPLPLIVSASGPTGATSVIKKRAAQERSSQIFCPPSIPASRISRARWRSSFTPPPPLFRCPLRALAGRVLARTQARHHRLHP